jgi:hypothetical protein
VLDTEKLYTISHTGPKFKFRNTRLNYIVFYLFIFFVDTLELLFNNDFAFHWFFSLFIHMCIHCLGHFSPRPLPPPAASSSPCFQADPILPYIILLKRRHKHNKKDKAFLLVELRIAIQRDS